MKPNDPLVARMLELMTPEERQLLDDFICSAFNAPVLVTSRPHLAASALVERADGSGIDAVPIPSDVFAAVDRVRAILEHEEGD